ncbi:MAG: TIGR03617 family F420-dependent LLM class oxidoreductase [Myxococcota bacterium]|jgi:probable F420-dependent oxidoreductase|nr:TIGR03617 family F420-dependent LLM class oxidoreductase [Myxococcota bacterium]
MQVWASMDQRMTLAEVAAHARRAEALGYDGLNVPDAVHDGLLVAQAALAATQRLRVATSVLVVFPRSPMNVAHAAWDLQAVSGGRFELGVGSQVRGNIRGRYSTEWTPPVPRMREYIGALRAIFACWQDGAPLAFEGEHYRFSRMQPFFNPGPLEGERIKIHLGAIGPLMTALAGEAADGLMCHPTNSSPRYLEEVVRPRLEVGRLRGGRAAESVELMAADLAATGPDPAAVAAAREGLRELFGFLFSTPAYWPSLDLYGWEDVGRDLHAMTREGRWQEMTPRISDEMLDVLVPTGTYGEIADLLRARYRGLATRLTFPMPDDPGWEGHVREVIAALQAPD